MQYVDIENWKRKSHYHFFRQMDYPHFNLCANVDISNLYALLKEKDLPFFMTMVYFTTRVANSIEEFRYRIRGSQVVVHDLVHPSFTLLAQPEVFNFCTAQYREDIAKFYQEAKRKIAQLEEKADLEDDPLRDDLLYITSIPWVSFTSITHPIHMHPADCVPRVSWGKFFGEGGKIKLPLSVQVHHALMDGLHVGKYFTALQELLDDPSVCFE